MTSPDHGESNQGGHVDAMQPFDIASLERTVPSTFSWNNRDWIKNLIVTLALKKFFINREQTINKFKFLYHDRDDWQDNPIFLISICASLIRVGFDESGVTLVGYKYHTFPQDPNEISSFFAQHIKIIANNTPFRDIYMVVEQVINDSGLDEGD